LPLLKFQPSYNSQISYLTEIRLAFLEFLYPYRQT